MKWDLYLSRRDWEELKAAVRERAPADERGRPCCERCGKPHGKLKKSKKGYFVPHWLHTAHKHDAPMTSKNPDDYVALCDACHMWYDRQPDSSGWIPPYRRGYTATTTDQLIEAMNGAGLTIWPEGEMYRWRIGGESGAEATPVLAVGSVIARLHRMAMNVSVDE